MKIKLEEVDIKKAITIYVNGTFGRSIDIGSSDNSEVEFYRDGDYIYAEVKVNDE